MLIWPEEVRKWSIFELHCDRLLHIDLEDIRDRDLEPSIYFPAPAAKMIIVRGFRGTEAL